MFKRYLIFTFIILFFTNKVYGEIFLIGHAYGSHGEKNIPYKPLKNFLKKNESSYLIFLVDMTENSDEFFKFYDYFKNKNSKFVRGNHDKNLYDKVSFWRNFNIENYEFINLDMDRDMVFDTNILNESNKIFLSHYIFFNKIFENISPANFMLNPGLDISELNIGKNNYFISGDCGLKKFSYSYIWAKFKENYFICTGLGSGWSNNVFSMTEKKPIFFKSNGKKVKNFCITSSKSKNAEIIKICLPKYNFNSIYMVIKFYKNIYFG